MNCAIWLIPIGLSLSGCIGNVEQNRPPIVRLDAVQTVGDAPFTVEWIEFTFDPDGDDLTLNMTDDLGRGGYSYTEVPAGSGTENGTTLRLETRHTWTFYTPGVITASLTVSDGIHTVSDSVVITVTGHPAFPGAVLRDFANVTADCAQCSGGMVGTPAALGAEGCQGFLRGENGTDCRWYGLDASWEGLTLYVNATNGADVDIELRTDCEPGPGKSRGRFIHDGYESRDLPANVGCVVVWAYMGAPATIETRVM